MLFPHLVYALVFWYVALEMKNDPKTENLRKVLGIVVLTVFFWISSLYFLMIWPEAYSELIPPIFNVSNLIFTWSPHQMVWKQKNKNKELWALPIIIFYYPTFLISMIPIITYMLRKKITITFISLNYLFKEMENSITFL